jgi:Flp pilus assembly protein TadG
MNKIVLPRALCEQLSRAHRIWTSERGGIALIAGIVATVVVAVVGLGIDVIGWYRTHRALQNAADSAAIAAATNGSGSFQSEAKAVAAQYGYVDGTGGVTVTAADKQPCPDGTTSCYLVTVAMTSAPQFFSQVIGLPAPALSSAAMAGGSQTHSYCILALASDGTNPGIRSDGSNSADLTGCSIMSDTGSTCNGHNLNATYGDAHGTNNGCGVTEHSNVPVVSDPYAGLANNIPANTCNKSAYQWEDKKGNGGNTWGTVGVTTTMSLPATTIVCGDLKLNGPVTLTSGSPGSVLVIENGELDTNGQTLSTASGSALTVIFSGDPTDTHNHYPTNSGTLDFMAPTTGPWKGVVIYQDPNLTKGLDFTYAGNNPTWDITGLVYLPKANVAFKGAVNKSSYGASCFALVVNSVLISGTGDILQTGGCAAAGLTLPTDTIALAGLVQ